MGGLEKFCISNTICGIFIELCDPQSLSNLSAPMRSFPSAFAAYETGYPGTFRA